MLQIDKVEMLNTETGGVTHVGWEIHVEGDSRVFLVFRSPEAREALPGIRISKDGFVGDINEERRTETVFQAE